MFGIIADIIASVTTILLPAYLSYKSLRTHDPAQTHPWLIYFTILSLSLLFESWALFIIGWIPFYSWIRLFFLLYLVLPQTQGAKFLYLNYLEPYVVEHETRIDNFISQTHERLQSMGLGYMNVVIEYIREKILGQTSPQPPEQQQTGYASYAQDLLSRFAMPSARVGAPTSQSGSPGAGMNVYNTLSGLAGAAMYTGRPRDPNSSSSGLAQAASVPDNLVSDNLRNASGTSTSEKSSILAAQRERLATIMKALETEQQNLDLAYGSAPGASGRRPSSSHSTGGGLKVKSKSEQSFEKVDYAEADSHSTMAGYSSHEITPPKSSSNNNNNNRRSTSGAGSGSWIPAGVTGWFSGSNAVGGGGSVEQDRDPDEIIPAPSSSSASGKGNRSSSSSKGWTAARDITEAMAQGMSSGVDTRR